MNIREFADTYGIDLDEYGYGEHFGRKVRYLEEAGLFQVGEEGFDRWANSEDFEFEVWQKKGQRALIKWLETSPQHLSAPISENRTQDSESGK